jgi:hypothetical protein
MQEKLQIKDEEFEKWRFFLNIANRIVYLNDGNLNFSYEIEESMKFLLFIFFFISIEDTVDEDFNYLKLEHHEFPTKKFRRIEKPLKIHDIK